MAKSLIKNLKRYSIILRSDIEVYINIKQVFFMKKISTILCFMLSIILFSACTEQDEPYVLDPNLVWLNDKIQEMERSTDELSRYFYVSSGLYEGGRVFIFANCCPHCNTVTPVYNEEGDLLGFLSYSGNEGIIHGDISDQKLYWKPKNSLCNLKR